MNTTQSIGYYTFEVVACVIILVVVVFGAIMASGALADRWEKFFGSFTDEQTAEASAPADQIGHTR